MIDHPLSGKKSIALKSYIHFGKPERSYVEKTFLTLRTRTAMTTIYHKLKKKPPELNHVVVMASKGLGKVRSFNIYFPVLLGIMVVFAIYFLFSFLLFARYFGEQQQENMLGQLEKEFQKPKAPSIKPSNV